MTPKTLTTDDLEMMLNKVERTHQRMADAWALLESCADPELYGAIIRTSALTLATATETLEDVIDALAEWKKAAAAEEARQ